MLRPSANSAIRLRGVRHNNLKNFDLDLPFNRLIVITGLSGSGKSSLAFDTLFAEGQRRYIETFSPYARQFFERMDKPKVDSIEGIPPAIAIEQRNAVRTTRSTVGTITEICDYMKLLWEHIAQLYCRQCGQAVRKDSPQQIWDVLWSSGLQTPDSEALIAFDLPLAGTLSVEECLGLITRQGYQRLLLRTPGTGSRSIVEPRFELNEAITPFGRQPSLTAPFEIVRIDEAVPRLKQLRPETLTVIQDRIKLAHENRARFVEACEQAYHFGKGKLAVHALSGSLEIPRSEFRPAHYFSNRLHCASCDIEYREPSSALFSFNHPLGACPTCRGFGRVISIDYELAVPDRSKTLAEGVVRPWLTGHGLECQDDLIKYCRIRKVPMDVPFERLPKKWQDWVINGDPGYGQDEDHEWPRAWYGVKGYFRWLESKAYKMHVRVLLSRYRSYAPCPDCRGQRFQPEALLYKVRNVEVGIRNEPNARLRAEPSASRTPNSELSLADFLGYLTLDRPTRTLSGGETERVNLTTCLGTRLVNTLYVLDEPSVGLHPRDTGRLIRILEQLRDLGNTVLVVEHEASVIRAADQIVDLGPGHGEGGGHVVFHGSYSEILQSKESLTGQYLTGRKRVVIPRRRPVPRPANDSAPEPVRNPEDAASTFRLPCLILRGASLHNLRNLTVPIPLRRLVCITGVSGSGKTTLVREVLLPALQATLKSQAADRVASDRFEDENEDDSPAAIKRQPSSTLSGCEHLRAVVLVDQSPLGKTPRSNPAVYIGAFDDIRDFFAQTDAAKQRGLNASAFSFNSAQGQCERCRGAGFEKIEMQFLSDVFIRCPACDGRRYRPHILEVKLADSRRKKASAPHPARRARKADPNTSGLLRPAAKDWSIADLLEATVDEVMDFFAGFADSRPAQRAVARLRLLEEVGLGYLRLGQPVNTLSGGESQRLKLVSHLAETSAVNADRWASPVPLTGQPESGSDATRPLPHVPDPHRGRPDEPTPTLFLFDEPTTGLHFDDVRVLLKVFQRLVDAGHSVLVIEHNLEVVKCADWVIDLGPEAGDEGGEIVAQGTPEDVAACEKSHTGAALREVLGLTTRRTPTPPVASVDAAS